MQDYHNRGKDKCHIFRLVLIHPFSWKWSSKSMPTWIVMDETIIPEVEDSEGRKSKKWTLFMLVLNRFSIIVDSFG